MTKIFKPTFNITNRITAGLTRIERARCFLEAASLSEDWVREMGRRALVLEAHHTTHIEGTQLAEVRERGELAIRRDVLVKEHRLSDRQAKALAHILEHGSLTIQHFEGLCPEVNRRSLQRDMKAMVNRGLIVTEGETHHLLYRLANRG